MGGTVLEGGCNCGAVRYAIAGAPLAVAVCHCARCRRQSGSAFSVNLVVKSRAVSVQGTLTVFEDQETDSGQPVLREFCARCGSPIRSVSTAQPGMAAIKAGTLDAPQDWTPTLHIFTCSALPWSSIPDGLPRFARGPQAPA